MRGYSSAAWKARTNNCVKEQAREERTKKEEDGANVDDSCTTDDQRKKPTYLLYQTTSTYVLRDLHLCTSCENNALVHVDQVGL